MYNIVTYSVAFRSSDNVTMAPYFRATWSLTVTYEVFFLFQLPCATTVQLDLKFTIVGHDCAQTLHLKPVSYATMTIDVGDSQRTVTV